MALPEILRPYADRKVRVVAGYGERELWALMDLLSGGQTFWAYDDYNHHYELVMRCELSIEDWTTELEESRFDPCA